MTARIVSVVCAALVLCGSVHAQSLSKKEKDELREHDLKVQACHFDTKALIGLSRSVLRDRCGIWQRSSKTVTTSGDSEVLRYEFFSLYLENGVVTSVTSY